MVAVGVVVVDAVVVGAVVGVDVVAIASIMQKSTAYALRT